MKKENEELKVEIVLKLHLFVKYQKFTLNLLKNLIKKKFITLEGNPRFS